MKYRQSDGMREKGDRHGSMEVKKEQTKVEVSRPNEFLFRQVFNGE